MSATEKTKAYGSCLTTKQHLTVDKECQARGPHRGWLIALIVINALVLISVYVFNGLSAAGPSSGLFKSTIGNQSRKYYNEITPAGWTFSIWGVIYAWQALWVLYSIVNLFRTSSLGPVYTSPPVLSPALFLFYILANCCTTAWLFLFDRDEIQAAFAALFFNAAFLICGLGASYKVLDKVSYELVSQNRRFDIWLVKGFVHNGLGIYATWTSIATLLNLALIITYSDGSDVQQSTASTIALGVLTVEILVFVLTDLIWLDRYSRYTFTPYLTVVVALIGSIDKNWESGATNSIFTAVLLALGCVALLAKTVVSIYRHITRPLYQGPVLPTLSGGDTLGKNVV